MWPLKHPDPGEKYSNASTLLEALKLGATQVDLDFDYRKGYIKFVDVAAVVFFGTADPPGNEEKGNNCHRLLG